MSIINISIKSKTYSCDISFDRRLIVIRGDSGVGKSEIMEVLNNNGVDVEVESTYPIIALLDSNWRATVKYEDNIICIADDQDFVETHEFASLFASSADRNIYFIIICRTDKLSSYGALSFSSNDVYRFIENGKEHYIEKMYEAEKCEGKENPELFLIEDSGSGKEFFSALVDAECKSAENGKSSIVKDILIYSRDYKQIFVVFDTASFGCHIEELFMICTKVLKNNTIIYMSDYECFEELLINTNLLKNLSLIREELGSLPEYANKYMSYEKFYESLLDRATVKKPLHQSHRSKLNKCYIVSCKSRNCHPDARKKCGSTLYGMDKFVDLLKETKYERLLEYHHTYDE